MHLIDAGSELLDQLEIAWDEEPLYAELARDYSSLLAALTDGRKKPLGVAPIQRLNAR